MIATRSIRPLPLPAAIDRSLAGDLRERLGSVAAWAIAGAFAMGAADVRANNYTVTADGDPGTGGLSLRQAIVLAMTAPNSVVEFAPSLIGSTITLTQGAIGITQPVAVIGPGFDKLAISGGKSSRIFRISTYSTASPVTISGLTLTDGYTGESSGGGALFSLSSSLVIENSAIVGNKGISVAALNIGGGNNAYYARLDNDVISNNTAIVLGSPPSAVSFGGFFKDAPFTVQVNNCTISGTVGGGGIYGFGNAPTTITGSTISGNTSAGAGGGIYAKYMTGLSVVRSTISGNSAAKGGGVYLNDSVASFSSSLITANSSAGDGGGILVTGSVGGPPLNPPASVVTVTDSSVSDNFAYDFGAGIDVKRAVSLTMQRSLVSGNQLTDFTSGANGGGLALQYLSGKTTISNSTFYRNFAYQSGGGIGIFNATVGNNTKIYNSTIVANATAYFFGNGIHAVGKPYIGSSILANNASRLYAQDLEGSFQVKYSLMTNPGGATITGIFNIGGDPQLAPLTMNGGPTMTMLPAVTSPALNAGNPMIAPGLDQRGVARIAAGVADIGAVERQTPEIMIMRADFE